MNIRKLLLPAMDGLLSEKASEWLSRWCLENGSALLALPADEANAVLHGAHAVKYAAGTMDMSPSFVLALHKLDAGTRTVPATRVLVRLNAFLQTKLDEPLSRRLRSQSSR